MAQRAESTHSCPARPRRAWWQWVVGLGLLGTAAGFAWFRYAGPGRDLVAVRPREIKVAAGLTPSEVAPAKASELAGCNLLLVTFDTTRADRIGCYGNERIRTFTLDRLASQGVLFSRVIAPTPTTLPSHTSIMTGLYPYHHGVRANGLYRLGDGYKTLAEILAENGYATGATVSASVLESQFGLAQGFGEYDDRMEEKEEGEKEENPLPQVAERAADKTTERAEAWLRAHAPDKFFLWVHFYDPHFPYEAPDPGRAHPYDAEIEFADAHLGRLVQLLDDLGLTDSTLVVVAGDHGEGLGQHDEWLHACLIYESTLHVPLIFRCGDRLGGGVHVDRLASLVDVMPTVLSMLGIDVPQGLDGVNLAEPQSGRRSVFLETLQGLADHGWAALLGVITESTKYIHGPTSELYDLAKDPFEQRDLIAAQPQMAAEMKGRLETFFGDDLVQATAAAPTHQLDPETLSKLTTLGYLKGVGGGPAAPADRPHPKEMIPLQAEVHLAAELEKKKGLDASIRRLEKLARRRPDFYSAHLELAAAYSKRGDLEQAEAELTRCMELHPERCEPVLALARLRVRQSRPDEALTLYQEAVSRDPNNFVVLKELGQSLMERGEYNEAMELLVTAAKIWPGDEQLPDLVVDAAVVVNRVDDVQPFLEEVLKAHPNSPMVRNALSRILILKQKYAEGVEVLQKGVELAPQHLQLVNNLAYALVTIPEDSVRKPYDAAVMMERACYETGFRDARYLHTLSAVYASLQRMDEAIAVAERAHALAGASAAPGSAQLTHGIGMSLERYRQLKARGVDIMNRYRKPPDAKDADAESPKAEETPTDGQPDAGKPAELTSDKAEAAKQPTGEEQP